MDGIRRPFAGLWWCEPRTDGVCGKGYSRVWRTYHCVIPRIVEKSGRISQYVDEEILCDNLSDRKQLMEEQSDVFIALPGGIGTIDEIFTIAAAHTIGYHHKLVILYNMKGFWNNLLTLLDNLQQLGMVRGNWRDYIAVANNLDDIKEILAKS